jgi:hypothetical protein
LSATLQTYLDEVTYPLHDPRPSGRRSAGALSRA